MICTKCNKKIEKGHYDYFGVPFCVECWENNHSLCVEMAEKLIEEKEQKK